ncbi:FadR/GntR family transcriptional regulator [Sphingomonas immobilis]|uniref:FCD domain-containing protein n=1 Tax=Sphingomonas immobilis TaxID=3063997 RepID=A0ABT8ZXD1_9SPHN|nr:FCD domain-containing protein [Sphingomonas sp. CA1-15]MDO7842199.1 FCD domain-containing protein [Sphingomonas sp. CA1-15]
MVAQTVAALTRMSLAADDGDHIGAEADLLDLLGVSRPTLRQAAKVVENDRLIEVRRGAGGGFYAARPNARDAIQAPALWLKLQSATLEQMHAASRLIFPHAAASAAACREADLIAELRALRDELETRRPGEKRANETVETEVRLNELIGRMTGDPVMQLFMAISYSFGLLDRSRNLYGGEIARRLLWLELQRRLCDSILAGDVDLARQVGFERGETVTAWISGARSGIEARTGKVVHLRPG